MSNVVNIKDAPKSNLRERTFKVSLSALALAIEYYTEVAPDEKFVAEARSSLLRHDLKNVCCVSRHVHDKVMKDLPLEKAVKTLLYA